MSNSTSQPGSRIALAAILVGGLVVTLVWFASQITNLRRDQAEQAQRIAQTVAAAAAIPVAPAPAPPAAAVIPPNWSDQIAAIRNETRTEIAKLQEQIARKEPAEAQLAALREENRTEIARLREAAAAAPTSDPAAAKQAGDRQEELLRSLRDQVRTLDRRTAALASSVRSSRSVRMARTAKASTMAKRKRLAVYPISVWRNRNVATARAVSGK